MGYNDIDLGIVEKVTPRLNTFGGHVMSVSLDIKYSKLKGTQVVSVSKARARGLHKKLEKILKIKH